MPRIRAESLKSLIRRYQIALLIILAAVAGASGLWAAVWQSGYDNALRFNGLMVQAQAVRADLYRQIKALDTLPADADHADYWQRLYRIDDHFYRMHQYADTSAEQASIARMEAAYGLLQAAMNSVVTHTGGPTAANTPSKRLHTGDFESAYERLTGQVAVERARLSERLDLWNRWAPWLAWLPLAFGLLLAFWLKRRFAHGFLRPLERLVAAAAELAHTPRPAAVPKSGVAELRHLAQTLNTMAAELERRRRELIEQERQAALGALVPVIAHNIRNPLAGIRANAQTLDDDAGADDVAAAGADIIDATDRLERWLGALLSYLHPLQLDRRRLALDRAIEAAVAALGARPANQDVTIEHRRSQAAVAADAALLEQALYGLLANALEASPRGATIRVSSTYDRDRASATIDDQGPGMAVTPDPQTTTPLATTKRRGTGLGIPFAYKVIHAHDGSLDYARAPAGGTRVRIRLPRADP